ncbi:Early-responsive to dehydration stress protein (ERD4) isoform 1 [Hibiscus syriacus]|uniref:Early-responsive to dehydration stress protein (ERD4) isoform 1 n=1 Tax=Hibiscus syriacus TaxID=106335 RepID=A0A6A3BGT8_HIBSY|nr:Early-responsive to dehydration stress protein (ERD4) isoform 1 [Hibiscus syriacus]
MQLSPMRNVKRQKTEKPRTKRVWRLKVNKKKKKKKTFRPTVPLAQLIQLPLTAADFIDHGDAMTPSKSPIENISTQWRELHGLHNWDGLIEPLHPWLRQEVVKYNRHKLFEELGLTKHGYKVTKYIYAMSRVDVPKWLERTYCSWSKNSNWMGYDEVSGDAETARIGRRDILVAWRGTVAPTEWYSDLRTSLQPLGKTNIKVQRGFLSIYSYKGEFTRYNKLNASEQIMEELIEDVQAEDPKEVIMFTETNDQTSRFPKAILSTNKYKFRDL